MSDLKYIFTHQYALCCLWCLFSLNLLGQDLPNPKQLQANRIVNKIQIDGVLNEIDWVQANIANDFVQNDPLPGSAPSQKTDIKVIYDNHAIYIGAMLYDSHPDSILQELTERDNIGNTDWFGVLIDAYQDGSNAVGFYVTPAGIQFDTKYSALGGNNSNPIRSGDRSWDAVWTSNAKITDKGWIVEMKIPYSALRFPNAPEQQWNINFSRTIRRNRELLFWNEVNPQLNGLVRQSGAMTGITNVKAPVRLSATPFVAAYVENYYNSEETPKSSWGRSFSGGMDIKYGINDAFTLDMTLIPDFGEAISDNQVLNLSPFEVRFNENRPFFTEGTELFNKGNLFYSRRVGGRPIHYWDVEDSLEDGEEIIENPQVTQLYNATKVSGRTNKGLGVGVFNAIAGKSIAKIEKENGDIRTIETSPLTNYNVVVFDQNLKNNSFVSFINTNVFRAGETYDANVTGMLFNLKNKDNSYGINGNVKISQKYYQDEDNDFGHTYTLGINKLSGNFTWNAYYSVESHDYDPNDLGFLFSPNEKELGFSFDYEVYKPFGKIFNSGGFGAWTGYSKMHQPDVFSQYAVNLWAWARTKKFINWNIWTFIRPFGGFDYFEPRTDDFSRYYKNPSLINTGFWVSTDYRKKFAIDFNSRYGQTENAERHFWAVGVGPRFRVSDKLSFRWRTFFENSLQEEGYVDNVNDNIIFGKRDRVTVENTFNTSYTFNNKMSLSVRLRHYWSKANYNSFHLLLDDGALGWTSYDEFNDNSFNAFNIDAIYRWRFAPGSDIFVIWKNGIFGSDNELNTVIDTYGNSLDRLGQSAQSNSLSLKIVYFIDYLYFAKKQ